MNIFGHMIYRTYESNNLLLFKLTVIGPFGGIDIRYLNVIYIKAFRMKLINEFDIIVCLG